MATLQIIVKNGDMQNGDDFTPETPQTPQTPIPAPDNKDKTNDRKNRANLGIVGMIAGQALSYTTSNVGKWTGDSRLQAKINMGMNAVGLGVAFAVNPVLGAISLTSMVVTSSLDRMWQNNEEQLRLQGQRARNGYSDIKSIFTSRRH